MELGKIVRFRNIWIGVAMLWIIFYHSGFEIESGLLLGMKSIGYGGVDICLFASGVGCYYSLEKDPEILGFLRRRISRLGPTYLCFIVPWLLWRRTVSELPMRAILGNILGVQSLVSWEYHFNWYIGGLLLYYLAMPYLKRITDSCSRFGQDVLACGFVMIATIPFWEAGTAIVILSRMPVLYTGLVCGKLAKRGYVLNKRDFFIAGILSVAGLALLLRWLKEFPDLLWSWGLYWYPFALIVPGGCLFFSVLAEKMEKYRVGKNLIDLLQRAGVYSFELYLVHVFMYEGLMPQIRPHLGNVPNNLLWLATIPAVVGGAYLLNRLTAVVSSFVKNRRKKHD